MRTLPGMDTGKSGQIGKQSIFAPVTSASSQEPTLVQVERVDGWFPAYALTENAANLSCESNTVFPGW